MRIAVVGSGISGLVCAHLLGPRHDVVLFESDSRVGGHTHTRELDDGGRMVAVDTGFIVFNERTYPSFVKLLRRLGVAWQESDMSFSARSDRRDFEYAGPGLSPLYAQRRNLLSPGFHRMVLDVLRFYREARELLAEGPEVGLVDWLERRGYSRAFVEDHILPMAGAVWSSSRSAARDFPARFLVRFFDNHGFLDVSRSVPWLTLRGGSHQYVRAILAGFRGEVRTGCPVERVLRAGPGVEVKPRGAAPERFDHLVLACHADQALGLLADPSPVEKELLSAFPYRENRVQLHRDARVMPRSRPAWSSWNYHLDDDGQEGACVTYWMNRLQRLQARSDWFVSLNRDGAVDADRVQERIAYQHPVFSADGLAAQARHAELIGHRDTSYCGAYWRNGFHEDGVVSALQVCQRFGASL
jgi:predicted NAD/FAD-binding protein